MTRSTKEEQGPGHGWFRWRQIRFRWRDRAHFIIALSNPLTNKEIRQVLAPEH